jgi:flagellar M-ring protein FliF
MKNFITQAISQFGAIWKRIGVNQRISIVLVGILIIIALWAFVSIARKPDYEPLFTNVTPEDGAAITSHLAENDIPYKLRGSIIYIPANRKDEVRMELAAKGLPKSSDLGWNELFPSGSLLITDRGMQINYVRALQVELARSIESISCVQSAKVHIVIPEPSLYSDEQKPATASVVIGLRPGAVPGEEQKNAIRYLVSRSIEGLDVKNITIIDTDGKVYASGSGDGPEQLTGDQLKYKKQIENELSQKAQSMLEKTLGPGKSIVQVTAEVNFDEKSTIEKKTSAGAPIEETSSSTNSKESSEKSSGEPGVESNIVKTDSDTGESGASSEKTETTKTTMKPSETVIQLITRPGVIKRLSIAAIIDKNREKGSATNTDFEQLIKGAVGFDDKRGDTVVVSEMDFAAPPEEPAAESSSKMSAVMGNILKNLPLGIVIIVLLAFFRHLLKKTKLPETAVPEELRRTSRKNLEAIAAGDAAEEMTTTEAEELLELPEHAVPPMQKLMWKLADEKPEDLAQMLRSWLKD